MQTATIKHKWAQVIAAALEDKVIQHSLHPAPAAHWVDSNRSGCGQEGATVRFILVRPELYFRIKPEPKPDTTKYIYFGHRKGENSSHVDGVNSDLIGNKHAVFGSAATYPVIGILKVVLDGETQELKSVEIAK